MTFCASCHLGWEFSFLYLGEDLISTMIVMDLSKGFGPWSAWSPSSYSDLVVQHHPFLRNLLIMARGAGQTSAEIVLLTRPKWGLFHSLISGRVPETCLPLSWITDYIQRIRVGSNSSKMT